MGKTKTMSHKSLYSRLKPEYLELFEKSNLKHPEIIGRILDSLEQHYDKRFIIEMGCVEVKSKSFTPIHKFDLTT